MIHILGPVERVAIPKDKEGNNRMFGFVTYKHLKSVNYAMNIFAGTRLFGRELQMRSHRKDCQIPLLGNQRENQYQPYTSQSQDNYPSHRQAQQPSTSRGNASFVPGLDMSMNLNSIVLQQNLLRRQQIMAIAATHTAMTNLASEPVNMHGSSIPFGNYGGAYSSGPEPFREQYSERNRNHREERRDSRSRPYRRSPSPSPQQSHRRRERPPGRLSDGGRRQSERSNYQRRDTR